MKSPAMVLKSIVSNSIVLIIVALLILLYIANSTFFTSKERVEINYREISLKSIKEISELHLAREVVSQRITLVFDDKATEENKIKDALLYIDPMTYLAIQAYDWYADKSSAIDYVALCYVDATISMEEVQFDIDLPKNAIHITIPEVVIQSGLTNNEQSFVWNKKGKLPPNAIQRAISVAEQQATQSAVERNIASDAYENAKTFFEHFFKPFGFSQFTFTIPSTYTISEPGQSSSQFINRVLALCRSEETEANKRSWHVDPHLPAKKIAYVKKNFEGLDLDDLHCILFFDTHKQANGKTGLVLSDKGLHWENGYWRSSKDTKKNFLTWDEFRNSTLEVRNTCVTFGDKENAIFFDVQNKEYIENIILFLRELQKIQPDGQ